MNSADAAIVWTSDADNDGLASAKKPRHQRSPHISVSPASSSYRLESRRPTKNPPQSVSGEIRLGVSPPRIASDKTTRRRSHRQLTPEQYANSVNAHARRSIVNSLYPGQNYIDLAAWLKAEERQKDSTQHCLAVLRDFSLVGSDRVQYLRVDSLDAITNRPSHPRPEQGSGRVLFLRGCPPAKWITAIGGRYGVDPEFVHRHLDFFATLVSRSVFSLPSLPSSSGNIIKLRVCTILHQQDASMAHVKKLDLQARRREAAENMATYRRNFQTACQAGDSIVRDFSAINKEYCILEQQISICVQKDEDGWLAIVWLDVGKDLSQSPSGPWLATEHRERNRNHETFPVIQHHPKMTLREGAIEAIISSGESNPMSPYPEEVLMRQSTALLPFEFDRLLDSNTANGDAFYALHYVFEHAAYSEVQVLNIIEAQLEEEMGVLTIERHRSHSLEDLHFLSMFLDRHVHQISETLRTIREKGHSTWPAKSDKGGTTSSARKGLEEDFEDLLARAVELRRRCTEGMGIMMNRAVVAESRKAIEQNERLKRLTLLASFFIPLSFTTSLFGMNFVEFGQGKQPLWLFAAVSVPVLMLSYCAYVWDDIWSPLRRIVVTWARRYFKIRRQAPRRDHDA